MSVEKISVAEARKVAKDEGEIVVVGRIGGSEKPFVSGMAAFTIEADIVWDRFHIAMSLLAAVVFLLDTSFRT